MANEIQIIKANWLELKEKLKDLPSPFSQETFLMETHVAGTSHIDDIVEKTASIAEGDVLTLQLDPANKYDQLAIAIYSAEKERLGWVPQRKNEVISRLMDAGKLIYAKLKSKELKGHWLEMRIEIFMRDNA